MSNIESSAPIETASTARPGAQIAAAGALSRLTPAVRRSSRRSIVLSTLCASDLAVALVADQIGYRVFRTLSPMEATGSAAVPALVTIVFFLCLGLYVSWGLSPVERLRLRSLGIIAFVAVNLVLAIIHPSVAGVTSVVVMAIILLILGHYGEYFLRKLLIRSKLWGAPTVLLGQSGIHEIAGALETQPEFGLRPVGFLEDGTDPLITRAKGGLPFLGRLSDAERLSQIIDVALVVVPNGASRENEARLMRLPFPHVVLVTDPTGKLGFGGIPMQISREMVGLSVRRDIYKRGNRLFKRGFDILISAPLVLISTPLVLALALAIKIIDPGPGFFRQRRVGQDGRDIEVLKLRTMYTDADARLKEHLAKHPEAREEWKRYFKLKNDPRVLPFIGNFVRRTSLDELPQLVNVLCGNMSLVGPRPFPAYHLDAFDEEFRMLRASVPPGLTGFWQVSARSDGDLAIQRIQDSFYIQNWSIWLDFWILLQTVPAVIGGQGAR